MKNPIQLTKLKTTPALLITAALLCFALLPRVQAGNNTAYGDGVLANVTTGENNSGFGWGALFSNTSGRENTAIGAGALVVNTTGINNTAVGTTALLFNTTGEGNTATGAFALFSNTQGKFNTANGEFALYFNTIGERNTAIGDAALYRNTEGSRNTAIGNPALLSNTTGAENTAVGASALYANNGTRSTATGARALRNNTTGTTNTANGYEALDDNTTGNFNTAIGAYALTSNTIGNQNTALGILAGQNITGNNNVCIGAGVVGEVGVHDTTYIRNVNTLTQNFSAGVNNYVTVRLSDGRLGNTAVVSSQRYKQDIKPLAMTSEALYSLKPVSFRLKKEFDATQALSFGLIAEEVQKVDPALVYRNAKGQVESVRYEMVNAMLLNEFLKEHRKVEQQQATITQLEKDFDTTIAQLTARLDEQASQIQKVSAQIEASKPAPQMVNSTNLTLRGE